MKIRAILLLFMIGIDASYHWVDILNKTELHPLYPNFPLFGILNYDFFWTIYWTIAFILMLTLLGSNVVVKHTTEIHNHPKNENEM